MKKIILVPLMLILWAASFGQQSQPPSLNLSREDYLTKSKHQKTAAWSCWVEVPPY